MSLANRLLSLISPGSRERHKERKRASRMKAREKVFQSDTWQRETEVAHRKYANYEEYVAHQSGKLDRIGDRLRNREDEDRAKFVERFEACPALADARVVICLGARLGTEVAALHELGHFAVGIDLNPGPGNEYVLVGDFHRIVFPDGSADAIYTNALDHVFDLEKMLSEVRRLLRPGGAFVVDLVSGYEEGFYPGAYESIHWRTAEEFTQKLVEIGGLDLEGTRDLGKLGRDNWVQAVLRRPSDANSGESQEAQAPISE